MKTEINFSEYLSEEERKEIIAQVFREKCEQQFSKDCERIFSNAAYEIVWKAIDAQHNGNTDKVIAEKALSVIEDLTVWAVFRQKDAWGREESVGYKSLCNAILSNKDVLDSRITQIIAEIEEPSLRDFIMDAVTGIVEERLFNGGKNNETR